MKKWYIQLAITLPVFALITAVFPIVCWFLVVSIFHLLELATGYHAPLVSSPSQIDPGAIIVLSIYILLSLISSFYIYSKALKVSSIIVGFGALVASPYVFSIVSSVIWF